MKLLSYNIRYGGVGREDRLAAVIREASPDLVVLQEATRRQVVERLAEETRMRIWGAKDGYSCAFLSRLEVASHVWHRPPRVRRAFLEIVLAGTEISVYGIHLSAVHSYLTERRRVRELRALLKVVERHGESFHVLAGDFNTLAPGEILDMRQLPGRLRPLVWITGGRIRWETIQMMLNAGYLDGYRAVNLGNRGYTFPTWNPHVRLDYIFLPVSYASRLMACEVVNSGPSVAGASDHFPLLAQIDGL